MLFKRVLRTVFLMAIVLGLSQISTAQSKPTFRQLVKEGKAEERAPRRFQRPEAPQQAPRTGTGSGLGENTPIAR